MDYKTVLMIAKSQLSWAKLLKEHGSEGWKQAFEVARETALKATELKREEDLNKTAEFNTLAA